MRWVFEAAPKGVVTDDVMKMVRGEEDELVAHIFGADRGGVSEAMMRQAVHPVMSGGLGLLRLERCGRVVDGKWVARSKEEIGRWDAESDEAVRRLLADDRVGLKKWVERRGVQNALAWVGSGKAIMAVASTARSDGDSEVAFGNTLLAGVVGGRVWPADLDGIGCPMQHGARGPAKVIREGPSAHFEQCEVLCKVQRHGAIQEALFAALGRVGQVWKEMSPAAGGRGMVPRTYIAGDARGRKYPGDVVVRLRDGRHVWFDTTMSSAAGTVAIGGARSAADVAYDGKRKDWAEHFPHVNAQFTPIALSTSGVMAASSSTALKHIVGLDGVNGVIAAGMVAQTSITRTLIVKARTGRLLAGGGGGNGGGGGVAAASSSSDED
jgi:hypothetical protein